MEFLPLKEYSEKILVPEWLVIARREEENYVDVKEVRATSNIPQGYMIVDFKHSENMQSALEKAVFEKGRIIMAGTPGIFAIKNPDKSYKVLFTNATNPVIEYMIRNPDNSIVLGGDTAGEIKAAGIQYCGKSSSGGGSSLYYISHGTTPLLEALKQNKHRFSQY
ncbi:MAG: phosphoglycerate kinase [Nanoarchaeota archaeon]|nr:phosphoglycerate kinase [Nanoarchaeota archaeon]